MINTQNKKGFTLVELIVVITILAILGTIAFISLQGFSADARDAKRVSDLNNIRTSVTTENAKGASFSSMITGVSSAQLTTPSIGGANSTLDTNYWAGTVNYTYLNIKQEDFQDPKTSSDYLLGYTSKAGSAFQIAASKEESGGTALVTGDYNPRTTTDTATIDAAADTNGFTNGVNTTNTNIVKISAGVGIFKVGDTVNINSTAAISGVAITSISKDKSTITLASGNATGGDTISLAADEVTGLINSTTSGTPVTNSSTALPYSL